MIRLKISQFSLCSLNEQGLWFLKGVIINASRVQSESWYLRVSNGSQAPEPAGRGGKGLTIQDTVIVGNAISASAVHLEECWRDCSES